MKPDGTKFRRKTILNVHCVEDRVELEELENREPRVKYTDRLKRASDEQRNAIEYCPLLHATVLTVTRRRICFGHSRDKTARRHVNSDPPSQLEKEEKK